ncbi:MAG: VCBS repeat-containing protein, partial [Flavitalea sp.]
GGGVATGDLNGDGLEDLYFTANMSPNKLYLNEGKLKFRDITDVSGAAGRPGPWKTGVTIADVNGDGKPDIFISYSGKVRGVNRTKQLFINQGNTDGVPKFIESAAEYGLADTSYTTQAIFFDYDLDNDLDLLLLNHNPNNLPILDESASKALMSVAEPAIGPRLLENRNNKFVDVTRASGIKNPALSYGLGAAVSDINGDGWPDIYLSNDYSAPDYLYINTTKKGFTDELSAQLGQTSHFSMGNNISDINNDGLPDIFTLDMLPESNSRQKLLFAPDNYEKFNLGVRSGFYYQYMRNMLHVNNGNGSFSETGQFSGISNTDWSWAPLFADFDNDGLKDLFVTNGYTRDFTNMDFMKYMGDFLQNRQLVRDDILRLVQEIPSSSLKNYIFKNKGSLKFENIGDQWGFDSTANSNGAVYADLDNDGDLDLVVNNINQPAFVYENTSAGKKASNFLKVQLISNTTNTQALGTKVTIYTKDKLQFLEQMPNRGYQSVVSAVLHFGVADHSVIDSLRVVWPGGKTQLLTSVKPNQLLKLQQSDAKDQFRAAPPFAPIFKEIAAGIQPSSAVNEVNDFKRQPLMVNPLSYPGPVLAKGDVNGDGLEDLFMGNAPGAVSEIYLQQKGGRFAKIPQTAFESDKNSQDADAVFFDANGDGHTDLYVCSGGYHNFTPGDKLLQDRLYLNNGKGQFTKAADALPEMTSSKSCVAVSDINGDGFSDLFVGGRVIPGRYPETPESFILINDGKGKFTNKTADIAASIQKAGLVTDAIFLDLNNDKKNDLIISGEWMPVTVFINNNGKLENKTSEYFDVDYSGWWNKLDTADLNGDGTPELIAGNFGENSQIRASEKMPAELYYKDFDDNGAVDPILCCYIQGKSYPYVTRDELLDQISMMRTKYTDYKSYANTTLTDIFTGEQLKDAGHLVAKVLSTGYFVRKGTGKFTFKPLPAEAQLSPVFAMQVGDFDRDGKSDLILAGNINHPRLRLGKSDANYGLLLRGDGKGNFLATPQKNSGFNLRGEVRSITRINDQLLFGLNPNRIISYRY